MEYNDNYLVHHGILGQKWGKRNGPPYPLKSGAHTNAEKTGRGESVASGILDAAGNKSVAGLYVDPGVAVAVAQVAAYAALIGTVAVVQKVQYKKEVKRNSGDESNIQKRIQGKHSPEEDLKAVNPDFADTTDMGARVNCTMCSTAYELRRRGYDVVAQKSTIGRTPDDAAKWFNIDKKDISQFKTREAFADALSKEPDGARGLTFTAYGPFGSHHCMIWEKANGKITISDGQDNMPPKSIVDSGISAKASIPYRYIRTDNASINWEGIRDAVKERT